MKLHELEEAWALLEEAMKEGKEDALKSKQNDALQNSSNGANCHANQTNGKRKLLDESEDDKKSLNGDLEPFKKKIKSGEETQPASSDKFSWTETIRNILSAKNNELKLKKLKKKVLKQYQTFTGSEWSDKVENKFNKKINKLKGVVVDNEKVRLVD